MPPLLLLIGLEIKLFVFLTQLHQSSQPDEESIMFLRLRAITPADTCLSIVIGLALDWDTFSGDYF